MNEINRVMLQRKWDAARQVGREVRDYFSKEENTQVETLRLRMSVMQSAGSAPQGERTMVAKTQGQEQGKACVRSLGGWGWGWGSGGQIQQGFVGSAKEFGYQFQSNESAWKVLEQETDMM